MDRALDASGRSTTDGPAARRVRRALVAAEFALATPLLVAAVLVMASLDRLSHVPVGIDTARVLTAAVSLPGARYARDADREAFWERALERLAALPGVEAGRARRQPAAGESGNSNNFDLEDHPTPAGQNQPICTWVGVSPAFFKTVGLRARARTAARRALAAGGRRGRGPRVGEPVLPRPGGPGPPLPQRRAARRARGRRSSASSAT